MACISKLASAIAYDCDTGAAGLVSAMIINKADIAGFELLDGRAVTALTLVPGAVAYKIDTVKRFVTLSVSLKVNDGAPNAYTHSANLTNMYSRWGSNGLNVSTAMSNGSFVILARHSGDGNSGGSVYGLYYGMSATAYDRHSHDNGAWATITLSTPENVIGEDNLSISTSLYNSLYSAAVG